MRKISLWLFGLGFASGAACAAQPPMQPNPQMMQQLQAMQHCIQSIGPAKLQEMAEHGRQMGQEIKALCAAGKRDEAMSRGMRYGEQMAKDPVMKKMSECGADMVKQFATIPGVNDHNGSTDPSHKHICDYAQ